MLIHVLNHFMICSAYGQDIENSTYVSETSFCIAIATIGLVLFSHLMSQMQVTLALFFLRYVTVGCIILSAAW